MFYLFLILKSLNRFSFHRNHLAELIIKNNRLSFVIYRLSLCVSTGDIRLYKLLKKPLLTTKMAHVFTAPSDRIMFFVNDTSSVGSFVNVKMGLRANCK